MSRVIGEQIANGVFGVPAETGRYHLYISRACPFSSRAVIARRLKGLEGVVSMSAVAPIRDARGWVFTEGQYADPVNGFRSLSEAYEASTPGYDGRVSVPVLWDRKTGRVVSNDSGEIMRMLGSAFDPVGGEPGVDLYPEPLRPEIDRLNERIAGGLNNAVYEAGLATTQEDYERGYRKVFSTLDALEERLASDRYLLGERPTEPDWRLFPTLARFDPIYATLFKLNRNRLVEMPNLWGYTRDLYRQPGIPGTVRLAETKLHYHKEFLTLNPTGIVPLGGEPAFDAPHDRYRRFAQVRNLEDVSGGQR